MEFSEIEKKGFTDYSSDLLQRYGPLKLEESMEGPAMYDHFRVDEKELENELLLLGHYVSTWRTLSNNEIELDEKSTYSPRNTI